MSKAIFIQHQGDRQKLVEARHAARLEGPPTRTERVKFIRRVVGAPDDVAERMLLVLKAHKELDNQCRSQAEFAGLEVENLSVADIAYPLVTKSDRSVFNVREIVCVCVCLYVCVCRGIRSQPETCLTH